MADFVTETMVVDLTTPANIFEEQYTVLMDSYCATSVRCISVSIDDPIPPHLAARAGAFGLAQEELILFAESYTIDGARNDGMDDDFDLIHMTTKLAKLPGLRYMTLFRQTTVQEANPRLAWACLMVTRRFLKHRPNAHVALSWIMWVDSFIAHACSDRTNEYFHFLDVEHAIEMTLNECYGRFFYYEELSPTRVLAVGLAPGDCAALRLTGHYDNVRAGAAFWGVMLIMYHRHAALTLE